MDTINTISISEALDQLRFPSFFDNSERKAAYEIVILRGNNEEKEYAEEIKVKYPFDKPSGDFASNEENDFPIANTALSA